MVDVEQIADVYRLLQPQRWKTIAIEPDWKPETKKAALRLNGLGSLFYFNKTILNHNRLSPGLHGYMCSELESASLRLAMEIPRDHFKTTVASVGAPMWWALPFNDQDEELMRRLGYGDEWMRWMRRAHYTSTRTLIVSEIIDNAIKIGTRIDSHYRNNDVFRYLYPEIIPKSSMDLTGTGKKKDKWNAKSMTHNRLDNVHVGEGTYVFLGIKGALQSTHYERQVIDDPVGEKAIKSDIVMNDTCEWIRKLPGAFDSDPEHPDRLSDQLFIGNRWSLKDVGSFLRNEYSSIMKFCTHSIEGGCCELHPAGKAIFPEEFTEEKIQQLRKIWGAYHFSCQYENNPIAPDAVRFKMPWLRFFSQVPFQGPGSGVSIANSQQFTYHLTNKEIEARQDREEAAGATPHRLRMALQHEVKNGEVIEDIRAGDLDRVAILDPSHSETPGGRSRHAIAVLGIWNRPPKPIRVYLLECWAGQTPFEEMLGRLLSTRVGSRGLAVRWKVHKIYVESKVAGQQGWFHLLRDRTRGMGVHAGFAIRELKTERSANAKETRIIGMEPVYENGFFWVNRTGCQQFLDEYAVYPNGRFLDLLDVVGYAPQTWGPGSRLSTRDMMREQLNRRESALTQVGVAGY